PFTRRHIGPGPEETQAMLSALGYTSLDALIEDAIPANIRFRGSLSVGETTSEFEALAELRAHAENNDVLRSYIGLGYHDTFTPPVIQRKVLENPSWYTAYTPYQAEISQGRLEALLNFQTVVIDLTGLPIANASLLDEGTAAAEAMQLAQAAAGKRSTIFVSDQCHPQTIEVVRTRAIARGYTLETGDVAAAQFSDDVFAVLVQYPGTDGVVMDYSDVAQRAHDAGALVIAACDLLALTLLEAPGEWGADIAVGNSQRFGVPLGFGGPHAAFMSTRDEYKRLIPGRIIGVSTDAQGQPAMRMALQTREQHIRRERATSNVCTAQVLLAVIASFYAVYHGPEGLERIARRVHRLTVALANGLRSAGFTLKYDTFFDTIRVATGGRQQQIMDAALERGINLRAAGDDDIVVALDETVITRDLADVFTAFGAPADAAALFANADDRYAEPLARTSDYMTHPVFSRYRSETEMLRYIHRLES